MSPVAVRKVQLGDERVVYIRVQTAAEYWDMQGALETNSENAEISKAEKIKRGIAIKISATLCNDQGARIFTLPADPNAVMGEFTWSEVQIIAKAINESNGLTDKEVGEAEKN